MWQIGVFFAGFGLFLTGAAALIGSLLNPTLKDFAKSWFRWRDYRRSVK